LKIERSLKIKDVLIIMHKLSDIVKSFFLFPSKKRNLDDLIDKLPSEVKNSNKMNGQTSKIYRVLTYHGYLIATVYRHDVEFWDNSQPPEYLKPEFEKVKRIIEDFYK
jgi:hypothetical protein